VTDLLIRGGTVIDGTGAPAVRADVAVTNGKITDVGAFTGRRAMRMIDARGLVVSPGFIDIHSHSDEAMFVPVILKSNCPLPLSPATVTDVMSPALPPSPAGSM